MEEIELQTLVEDISLTYFNKPFKHQATFNSRLRTTGGRYHLETHNLDFNPKIVELLGEDIFIGIVKHELCHYHLHIDGKGYRHGDADFKNLLAEVDALRYTPSLEMSQDFIKRWEYECTECTQRIYRKRRFNVKKYICASCKGYFQLKGREKIKNGL